MQKKVVFSSTAFCLAVAVFFIADKDLSSSDTLIAPQVTTPIKDMSGGKTIEVAQPIVSPVKRVPGPEPLKDSSAEEQFIGPEMDLDAQFIEYTMNQSSEPVHIGEDVDIRDYEAYIRKHESVRVEIGEDLDEKSIDNLTSDGETLFIGDELDIESYIFEQYKMEESIKHLGKELDIKNEN